MWLSIPNLVSKVRFADAARAPTPERHCFFLFVYSGLAARLLSDAAPGLMEIIADA